MTSEVQNFQEHLLLCSYLNSFEVGEELNRRQTFFFLGGVVYKR